MASYTDTVTFTDNGKSYDLTLTVSGTGGIGSVTAISGTADGEAITGLDSSYNGPDNQVVSTTAPQFDYNGLSFDTADDSFSLYDAGGRLLLVDLNFQSGQFISNETFTVEPLCFLRGTHILTPGGDVPVESLRIGDRVVTLSRGVQPVRWIGTGKLLVPAGRRSPATPVIVRKDALEPGVPKRDLHLTKGHALYLQGAFIPVEFLVNHRSIVWDDSAKEVEFFHVELNSHEVMLAEGAPAESYRDEGNRWMFANANPAWDQPGIAPHAPVLTGGQKLDVIWRRLLDRSGVDLNIPTTTNPDLHLLVNGIRVDASRIDCGAFVFPLPTDAGTIVIASRAASQDELGRFRDPRRLGVAISRVGLWCGAGGWSDAGAEALTGPGFHAYEPAEDCAWTNGQALLPPALYAGLGTKALRLHVRHTTHYRLADAKKTKAA